MLTTHCSRCSKPLPELATKNADRFCSRKCCELQHGLSMAADARPGTGRGLGLGDITPQRTLGGVAVAVTRRQREAQARSLEAEARLVREARSGRHPRVAP